jgi:hypothetical protein
MATGSDEIVDRFMMQVMNDNILNTLYSTSGSAALVIYTEAWLLAAIDDFARVSNDDLTYIPSSGSSVVGYFTRDLTSREINILARAMVKQWLQQRVSNNISMGRFFVDREFRMSAPMLPSLKSYLIEVIESVDKLLGDYAWDGNDWSGWFNQTFSS